MGMVVMVVMVVVVVVGFECYHHTFYIKGNFYATFKFALCYVYIKKSPDVKMISREHVYGVVLSCLLVWGFPSIFVIAVMVLLIRDSAIAKVIIRLLDDKVQVLIRETAKISSPQMCRGEFKNGTACTFKAKANGFCGRHG
jgi:hypothetical protein